MMDIRKQTGLIVRKGKLFVQTVSLLTSGTLWSACAYDAWRTRNVNKAIAEAERVGGELWLFNPATGQLRPADMKKILKRMKTMDEGEKGDE